MPEITPAAHTITSWSDKPTMQRDKRVPHEMTDQFGRAWETVIDITAKPRAAPCAPINPKGWHDPLATPPKYLVFDHTKPYMLFVNVDQWIRDREQEHVEYNVELHREAALMSPADAGAALIGTGGADMSPALLQRVGHPPEAVEPLLALRAGNKFVAGLTSEMPSWAKPYFIKKVVKAREFPDAADETRFPDVTDEVGSLAPRHEPKKTAKVG